MGNISFGNKETPPVDRRVFSGSFAFGVGQLFLLGGIRLDFRNHAVQEVPTPVLLVPLVVAGLADIGVSIIPLHPGILPSAAVVDAG